MMCYRAIKPVDIGPVLPILDRLTFVYVNQYANDVGKAACAVVLQDKFPQELKEFISGIGIEGEIRRSLLRRLDPRQGMATHIDAWMPEELDWHRFQVPLVTDQSIEMYWPEHGESVHLAPGWMYEVRYDIPHGVRNDADIYRIHLQIDVRN